MLSPECNAGNDQIPNSLASEILTAFSKISYSSGKAVCREGFLLLPFND
jgi:hypothetical protein